jgi:hypothetical protein
MSNEFLARGGTSMFAGTSFGRGEKDVLSVQWKSCLPMTDKWKKRENSRAEQLQLQGSAVACTLIIAIV